MQTIQHTTETITKNLMHSCQNLSSNSEASDSQYKRFVLRVKKLDGTEVKVEGSLPSDASLHDLADEISRLKLAPSRSFGITLLHTRKQYVGPRPPPSFLTQ